VRQIEVRAFEKVQKAVKNRVAALQVQGVRGAAEQVDILASRDRTWQLMGVAP
jgi:hypothetical protein